MSSAVVPDGLVMLGWISFQGGSRALGRSLSEPRKTGRLELNSTDVRVVSMTDDEIKLRENHKTQVRRTFACIL